jgi:esterase/lipase superfamily enzyme
MVTSNFLPKSEYGHGGDRAFPPGSRLGPRRTVFASCVWPLLAIFLGAGCATPSLMPTPNLYSRTSDNPFADVPPAFRTNRVDVLYLTDRAPDGDPAKDPKYGLRRSLSLAFGMTTVCIGSAKAGSWNELVTISRSAERHTRVPMSTVETREVGRFPSVPTRDVEHRDQWVEAPESVDARQAAESGFKALVAERLALTPKKEVYVFIHGTGSDFSTPTYVMAGLWHFMGRCGVPVVYTWPSGGSGESLGGYDYDRESSEFTVYHLKQFLRLLATCPGIEKVHIIAHSRGTDTALAAIRELNIEIRASGGNTRKALKLGSFVLAAADMDLEVSSQRVSAERLMHVPEQMVLYVSPTDRRLRMASFFFGSKDRLGQSHVGDSTPRRAELLKHLPDIQFIDARVAGSGRDSHFYFYSHPAVSSDLILLLRDNRGPGAENGRPLTREADGLWRIGQDYPAFDRETRR